MRHNNNVFTILLIKDTSTIHDHVPA